MSNAAIIARAKLKLPPEMASLVNGFCKKVLQAPPTAFAVKAKRLAAISLKGSVW
jgi:hypothetical protein